MEALTVIVGRQDAEDRLRVAGEVLRDLMPGHSAAHELGTLLMPEIQGGCLWLRPPSPYAPLADTYADEQTYTIVYGQVVGSEQPASQLAAAYLRGDIDAVEKFDGAYTAIVVDRKTARVHVRGDAVSIRSLHYAQIGSALILSPQILGIAATGLLEPEWDVTTLASIVGIDWSVGRHSLLRRARITQPYECITWREGELSVRRACPLDFQTRIAVGDRKASEKQCDLVVDQMVEIAGTFAAAYPSIRINLTDGLDSRAILALFVGAGAKNKLTAATSGPADSQDVLGAQKLAATLTIPHARREPTPVSSDQFLVHAKLLAFLDSGDGSSKRALSPMPNLSTPSPSVSGNGGEIYRGNYYPVFGPLGHVPHDPRSFAKAFVGRLRAARFQGFDDQSHSQRTAVTSRLEACIATFRELGAESSDLADLLYLWERHGQWGASVFRRPWARGFSPFASPSAIRLFYRLPAPLGMHNDIHARAIRRYLPLSAYLRPFNSYSWVPLQRAGIPFFILRQAELAQRLAVKKVSLKLKRGAEMLQMEQVLGRMLAHDTFDVAHNVLLSTSSLPANAFGFPVVERLLQKHRERANLLDTLAPMISVELCKLQVESAYRLASGKA